MANRLNYYNPVFYANEALIWLKNRRGMYPRVYRAFENERREFARGDTINIRAPGRFTAQDAPASTRQDIKTRTFQIALTQYKEVAFQVPDTEEAYGGERLITEHIGPAVDALGDELDQFLYGMVSKTPHTIDMPASVLDNGQAVGTLAALRKVMVDNQVPAGKPLHYMATPTTMARLLADPAFSQYQGAGEQGVAAQMNGTLQRKLGFDFFETQNSPTLVAETTLNAATLTTGAAAVKNDRVITLNTSASQAGLTLVKGQVVNIVGSGLHSVTADTLATGNNFVSVPISPPLRDDVGATSTWSEVNTTAATGGSSYQSDLVFHPNAIAVAMVPLPQRPPSMGAQMFTASDPDSGISIRARMAYDNTNARVDVVFDMLYGGDMIDADLAARTIVR